MDVAKHAWNYSDTSGKMIIGVDIGQVQDFTAIVVIERIAEHFKKALDGKSPDRVVYHHHLRHAQRLPLNTPYPDVAETIGRMVTELSFVTQTGPRDWHESKPALIVDGTGVGRPVVDMMRRMGLQPISVAITGGREENSGGDFNHTVPKRNLIFGMVVAFQEGRLKIAEGIPAAALLLNELLNFKVKISSTGHESFDAARESIHDDLVLAAALAVWFGERGRGCTITPLKL